MKKLNNNSGFTIIELVLSFALIMIVITGLLGIIMNYRSKAQVEEIKKDLTSYKDNLTKDVEDDIQNLGITSIASCTEDTVNCVNITFKDATTKKLLANKTSLKDKYIKYGDIKYAIVDNIPSSATEAEASTYQTIVLNKNNTTILQSYVGTTKTIYKITIPIYSVDLSLDYGINIVAVKTN